LGFGFATTYLGLVVLFIGPYDGFPFIITMVGELGALVVLVHAQVALVVLVHAQDVVLEVFHQVHELDASWVLDPSNCQEQNRHQRKNQVP